MRKFLVVLDDSRECLNAMRYAALRAANTGAGVQILSIISPEEFQHWIGIADLMRAEARERIEAHFEVFAKWMRDKQGINPELIIREAKLEALRQLNEAQGEDRMLRERTDIGKRQFAAFLANFRALLERQLGEVDGLQAYAQTTAQPQAEPTLKKQA